MAHVFKRLAYGFQLTAARRRLVPVVAGSLRMATFQLTAARRRLGSLDNPAAVSGVVSTHSRPKAAGKFALQTFYNGLFQLTAARRRLVAGV